MKSLWQYTLTPSSPKLMHGALCFLRIGIGLLTIGHGIPKILGGITQWQSLGAAMGVVGIHFLPVVWGCLAACIEFFGGIALLLGLGTRIASFFLTGMMIIAYLMHHKNGDPFTVYSFPLSMAIIFATFMLVGGGAFSLDYWLYKPYTQTS